MWKSLALAALVAHVAAQMINPPLYYNTPDGCLSSTSAPTITFLDFDNDPVDPPVQMYYNQRLQYVINGIQGCTYSITMGTGLPLFLTIPYTSGTLGVSPGASAPFVFNAPEDGSSSVRFTAALYQYTETDQYFATQYINLGACAVPTYTFGTPALSHGYAFLQGTSGLSVAANINGQDGCQYSVSLVQIDSFGNTIPGGTQSLQSAYYRNGAPLTFTAPTLGSNTAETFYLSILPAVAAGPVSETPARLIVNPPGCVGPALMVPAGPYETSVDVLIGAAFSVAVTGTEGCLYVITEFGQSVVSPGPWYIQIPTTGSAQTYNLYVGYDTVGSLQPAATANAYTAVACTLNPFQIQLPNSQFTNLPTTGVQIEIPIISGVYGCTYTATLSLSPSTLFPLGSTDFNTVNYAPYATNLVLTMPQNYDGSGTVDVTGGSDSYLNIAVSTSTSCTALDPSFVSSSIPGSVVPGGTLALEVNAESGCGYSIWFFPSSDLVLQGAVLTSIPFQYDTSTDPVIDTLLMAPYYPGEYTVVLSRGTPQPSLSSASSSNSFTLTVSPSCMSTPPSMRNPIAYFGKSYSVTVQGALGCSYNILYGSRQLATVTLPAMQNRLTVQGIPGMDQIGTTFITVQSPGGQSSAAVLTTNPLCDAVPTISPSVSTETQGQGFPVTITGQVGCLYYFQFSNGGAFTPIQMDYAALNPGVNSATTYANPPAPPNIGTYQYGLTLTAGGPLTNPATLQTKYENCVYQLSTAQNTPLNTLMPTFNVYISNYIACGASTTGVKLVFGAGIQRRGFAPSYIATQQGPGSYSFTPNFPLSTSVTAIRAFSGTSSSSPLALSFLTTIPTGGGTRKRTIKCDFGQDRCPVRSLSGRIGFECVDDLYTNLERCGSCNGPDCSQIPNADVVACVDGRCVVESCEWGYVVSGGECVQSSFLNQLWLDD